MQLVFGILWVLFNQSIFSGDYSKAETLKALQRRTVAKVEFLQARWLTCHS